MPGLDDLFRALAEGAETGFGTFLDLKEEERRREAFDLDQRLAELREKALAQDLEFREEDREALARQQAEDEAAAQALAEAWLEQNPDQDVAPEVVLDAARSGRIGLGDVVSEDPLNPSVVGVLANSFGFDEEQRDAFASSLAQMPGSEAMQVVEGLMLGNRIKLGNLELEATRSELDRSAAEANRDRLRSRAIARASRIMPNFIPPQGTGPLDLDRLIDDPQAFVAGATEGGSAVDSARLGEQARDFALFQQQMEEEFGPEIAQEAISAAARGTFSDTRAQQHFNRVRSRASDVDLNLIGERGQEPPGIDMSSLFGGDQAPSPRTGTPLVRPDAVPGGRRVLSRREEFEPDFLPNAFTVPSAGDPTGLGLSVLEAQLSGTGGPPELRGITPVRPSPLTQDVGLTLEGLEPANTFRDSVRLGLFRSPISRLR